MPAFSNPWASSYPNGCSVFRQPFNVVSTSKRQRRSNRTKAHRDPDGASVLAASDVSRILFERRSVRATISLGSPLPTISSTRPAPCRGPRLRRPCGRRGGCLRLHAVGFAVPRPSLIGRCALTAPFHPCPIRRTEVRTAVGGLFSVALSLTLRAGPVAVSHHRVLSCSDFPPTPDGRQRSPVDDAL